MQRSQTDDYTWIDLDDRTPWWRSLVLAVGLVAIAAVLVAPWVVDLGTEQSTLADEAKASSSSYCRPQSDDLPRFLNPALASWNQFCEWFIEPNVGDNGN